MGRIAPRVVGKPDSTLEHALDSVAILNFPQSVEIARQLERFGELLDNGGLENVDGTRVKFIPDPRHQLYLPLQ